MNSQFEGNRYNERTGSANSRTNRGINNFGYPPSYDSYVRPDSSSERRSGGGKAGGSNKQIDISILSSGSYTRENSNHSSGKSSVGKSKPNPTRSTSRFSNRNAKSIDLDLSKLNFDNLGGTRNNTSAQVSAQATNQEIDSKSSRNPYDLEDEAVDFKSLDDKAKDYYSDYVKPAPKRQSNYANRSSSANRSTSNSRRKAPSRGANYGYGGARRYNSNPKSNKNKPSRKNKGGSIGRFLLICVELGILACMIYVAKNFVVERIEQNMDPLKIAQETELPDWIDVDLIDQGNPSRSGEKLDGINDIVVHYVGNPGTTAKQNRDFYNGWQSDVCSHFLVGMDGEIIMCIPLDEKSAASNHRNHDTISVEVCHPDATGEFTEASYESTLKLVRWLMDEFHLDKDHVIRHYDVTGKECPRYFVDHPEAWEKFKNDL